VAPHKMTPLEAGREHVRKRSDDAKSDILVSERVHFRGTAEDGQRAPPTLNCASYVAIRVHISGRFRRPSVQARKDEQAALLVRVPIVTHRGCHQGMWGSEATSSPREGDGVPGQRGKG
jgi:hypothetical protein